MTRANEAQRAFDAAAENNPPECTDDDRFTADHIDEGTADLLRAICRSCALIDQCADLANAIRPPVGFWAGRQRKGRGYSDRNLDQGGDHATA